MLRYTKIQNKDIKIKDIIKENIGAKTKFAIIQLTEIPFTVIKINGAVATVALNDIDMASPIFSGRKVNFLLKKSLKKYIPNTPA